MIEETSVLLLAFLQLRLLGAESGGGAAFHRIGQDQNRCQQGSGGGGKNAEPGLPGRCRFGLAQVGGGARRKLALRGAGVLHPSGEQADDGKSQNQPDRKRVRPLNDHFYFCRPPGGKPFVSRFIEGTMK